MATKISFRVEIISFTILFKHSIQKSLKGKTYWLSQFHMKNQCKKFKNSGFQNTVLYSKCEKAIFEVLFNLVKFPQPAYDISQLFNELINQQHQKNYFSFNSELKSEFPWCVSKMERKFREVLLNELSKCLSPKDGQSTYCKTTTFFGPIQNFYF